MLTSRRLVLPSSHSPFPKSPRRVRRDYTPRIPLYLGVRVLTDPAGRVRGTEIDGAERDGGFELSVHALQRHVRLAQEVESLEDDEARDDGVGRGDGGNDMIRKRAP